MRLILGLILMVTGTLYYGDIGELRKLFDLLRLKGYRVVGPKLRNNVIRLEELMSFDEMPYGYTDSQSPGRYRLVKSDGESFRVGPDSLKKYLYPPELVIFSVTKDWKIREPEFYYPKTAFFGIKPCDMASVLIMDRVQGAGGDPYYLRARENSIFIVENCLTPGETCFCGTMGTGPEVKEGFDISYTLIQEDNLVLFRYGSDTGLELLTSLDLEPAPPEIEIKYRRMMREAKEHAQAPFTIDDVPDLLEHSLNDEIWKKVSEKCLGCANCNMVCPTCFCFDVIDEPELDGSSKRVRIWDGCHSYIYAEIAGANLRKDLWARYRHWVLHKFNYWQTQFGTLGCVGCGRCITWCPAGIDLRQVVYDVVKEVQKR
ncbi:MAG TPA: hypothetical protein ENF25_05010 [Thermoprotei archaeon]|nr:hypothetical protein [Thermoprotei archaeon]